jgi:hypothetical protein
MTTLQNAAPMVIDRGTRDYSSRVIPTDFQKVPQHLPKFYVFAEKGPIGPTYIDLNTTTLTEMYGEKTFDVESKYYTHSTPFVEKAAANANNLVIHRLIPADAKDVANLQLYLDVLPTTVTLYQKNTDGSIKYDANSKPVPVLDANGNPVTVSGYKVKWVVKHTVNNLNTYQPGLLTIQPGTQVDSSTNTQSQQYPIFEFAAADAGEYGNRLAVRMWPALTTDIDPFPDLVFNEAKNYPYYFQLYKLADEQSGRMEIIYNNTPSLFDKFILEQNQRDPASGNILDAQYVINEKYVTPTNQYKNEIGAVRVYYSNINTLIQKFYDSEKNHTDAYTDALITSTANNYYAMNVFTFTNSNGSPYNTINIVDDTDSTRITKNTNLFLAGAFDGVMNEDIFDTMVHDDLLNYGDSLHEYQDLVKHPESIIYDTGFKLATKKAMGNFIAKRKDTYIIASTYAFNAPSLTVDEQYSVAVALKATYQLYPESTFFATPTMRASIVGGSGEIVNSNYKKRVPKSYDILHKASRYMGASNGKWKNGYLFDREPGSVITELMNLDATWVPASVRNTLWSVGLIFSLNFEIRKQFFPALRTIYEDDTSVLNNFFTAMAICYLNKVAHAAWRKFSGSISLTNAQLEEQVNRFVSESVKDAFDGLFVIKPDAKVTELDALKGYSWTLPIKIYANNMKTVMETYVEAYRMSDLPAQ